MRNVILTIFIITSTLSIAQEVVDSSFTKSGLCSNSLKLYADSTYIYETGCEGRSKINFGSWTSKGDSILITPVSPLSYNFIDTVYNNTDTCRTASILLEDIYGEKINLWMNLLLVDDTNDIFIYKERFGNSVNTTGESIQDWRDQKSLLLTNLDSVICFDKNYNFAILTSLSGLVNKLIIINLRDFENPNITIKLSVHSFLIQQSQLEWIEISSEQVNSLLR